jgi:hypothetical protein
MKERRPNPGTKPGAEPKKQPETEPAASVRRTFKRTYIGDHGIFLAGETYLLTREQRRDLADDLE